MQLLLPGPFQCPLAKRWARAAPIHHRYCANLDNLTTRNRRKQVWKQAAALLPVTAAMIHAASVMMRAEHLKWRWHVSLIVMKQEVSAADAAVAVAAAVVVAAAEAAAVVVVAVAAPAAAPAPAVADAVVADAAITFAAAALVPSAASTH